MIKNLDIIVDRIGNVNKCLGNVIKSCGACSEYGLRQHDLNIGVLRHSCKLLLKDIDLVFGEEDEY